MTPIPVITGVARRSATTSPRLSKPDKACVHSLERGWKSYPRWRRRPGGGRKWPPPTETPSGRVRPGQQQAGLEPAEPAADAEHHVHLVLPRGDRDVVQIALRVGVLQVRG